MTEVELFMVVRDTGDIKPDGYSFGYINKGTRFYKDLRGVRAFLRSNPNSRVYRIVGKAWDVTDDIKDTT